MCVCVVGSLSGGGLTQPILTQIAKNDNDSSSENSDNTQTHTYTEAEATCARLADTTRLHDLRNLNNNKKLSNKLLNKKSDLWGIALQRLIAVIL